MGAVVYTMRIGVQIGGSCHEEAARIFGPARARLESKGAPIGSLDTVIGAHALSRGITLITNNTREFKRIPRLQVEDWSR